MFLRQGGDKPVLSVEITDHSPDGSNVEKRYPLIWMSRKHNCDAFVISRYLKRRQTGQINRLPYRHSKRNLDLAQMALMDPNGTSICQIVPVKDLHLGDLNLVPNSISKHMPSFEEIGEFLAFKIAGELGNALALSQVQIFISRLKDLAEACMENSTDTDASSLLKLDDRWIQVY